MPPRTAATAAVRGADFTALLLRYAETRLYREDNEAGSAAAGEASNAASNSAVMGALCRRADDTVKARVNARMAPMAKAAGWMKLALALVLTGVLGAAAALVALKAFFPEPKLRAMVVDGARKQLGRDVKLAHISLGLRGLSLDGLEISEFPDFAAGTFLSVERFRLRPSWRALLKKKLVVSTVDAHGLKVSVARRADGTYNFSTLASSAPTAAATPAAPAERPEFAVHRVKVTDAAFDYKDAAAGQSWQVSEAAFDVRGFGLLAPFDLEASARVRGAAGGRPVDAKFAFDATVDPARGDVAKLKVKARRLSLEAEGLTLKGSAEVDGLTPPRASFDATLATAGKTLLAAEGEVRLSSAAGGDFNAVVKAETDGLDTTLLAKWLPSSGVPALSLAGRQTFARRLAARGPCRGARVLLGLEGRQGRRQTLGASAWARPRRPTTGA